jgi:hypothetical protein
VPIPQSTVVRALPFISIKVPLRVPVSSFSTHTCFAEGIRMAPPVMGRGVTRLSTILESLLSRGPIIIKRGRKDLRVM